MLPAGIKQMRHNTLARHGIRRLLWCQAAVTVILSACFWLLYNHKAGYSSLLAGLVFILPGYFFAKRLFKHSGATAAKQIVMSMYVGEAVKLILAMMLFVIVFNIFTISAAAFFITYILLQFTIWLMPLFLTEFN